MNKPRLQLFVWQAFSPDYNDGLAFAIAENVEAAMKLIIEEVGYDPTDWGSVEVFPIAPVAFACTGGS